MKSFRIMVLCNKQKPYLPIPRLYLRRKTLDKYPIRFSLEVKCWNLEFWKSMNFQFPLKSPECVRKLFWELFWLPETLLDNPRYFLDTTETSRIDFEKVENLDFLGLKMSKIPKLSKISKNLGHRQLRNFVCVCALLTWISSQSHLKFGVALIFHFTD